MNVSYYISFLVDFSTDSLSFRECPSFICEKQTMTEVIERGSSFIFFCCGMQVFEEEIGGVKGHFGPINALAFNPDGRRCAS